MKRKFRCAGCRQKYSIDKEISKMPSCPKCGGELGEIPVDDEKPSSRYETLRTVAKAIPWKPVAVAGAVIAVFVIVGIILNNRRREEPQPQPQVTQNTQPVEEEQPPGEDKTEPVFGTIPESAKEDFERCLKEHQFASAKRIVKNLLETGVPEEKLAAEFGRIVENCSNEVYDLNPEGKTPRELFDQVSTIRAYQDLSDLLPSQEMRVLHGYMDTRMKMAFERAVKQLRAKFETIETNVRKNNPPLDKVTAEIEDILRDFTCLIEISSEISELFDTRSSKILSIARVQFSSISEFEKLMAAKDYDRAAEMLCSLSESKGYATEEAFNKLMAKYLKQLAAGLIETKSVNTPEAQQRLKEIIAQLEEAQKSNKEMLETITSALSEYQNSPLTYTIRGGDEEFTATIASISGDIVFFKRGSENVPLSLTLIDPAVVGGILEKPKKRTPEEDFKVGLFYLQACDSDKAKAFFDAACKKNPKLKPMVPKIDEIAGKKPVRGAFTYREGMVCATYTKATGLTKDDFDLTACSIKAGDGFYLNASGKALAVFKAVPFLKNSCSMTLKLKDGKSRFEFGLMERDSKDSVKIVLGADTIQLIDGKTTKKFKRPQSTSFRLVYENGKLTLRDADRTTFSETVGILDNPAPFIGGSSSVKFTSVSFSGQCDKDWYAAKISPLEEALKFTVMHDITIPAPDPNGFKAYLVTRIEKPVLGLPLKFGIPPLSLKTDFLKEFDKFLDSGGSGFNMVDYTGGFVSKYGKLPHLVLYHAIALSYSFQVSQAQETFDEILQDWPNFAGARAQYAWFLARSRKDAEAEAEFKRAIEIDPLEPVCYALYAEYLAAFKQKYEEADKNIRIARSLDSSSKTIALVQDRISGYARGQKFGEPPVVVQSDSSRYIVRSYLTKEQTERYAKILEAARDYFESFTGLKAKIAEKPYITIFKNREQYLTYVEYLGTKEPFTTAGMFVPPNQLILFEMGAETFHTMIHEGFHHFLFICGPGRQIPLWVNEGTSEYVAGIEVDETTWKVKKSGGILRGRLYQAKQSAKNRKLNDFVKITNQEFYNPANAGNNYAQGWATVHYFCEYSSSKYRDVYVKCLRDTMSGSKWDDAFFGSFPDTQLQGMSPEYQTHVEGLN